MSPLRRARRLPSLTGSSFEYDQEGSHTAQVLERCGEDCYVVRCSCGIETEVAGAYIRERQSAGGHAEASVA